MHKKKAVGFIALVLGALVVCGQPITAQACECKKGSSDGSGPTVPAPTPPEPTE